MHRLKLQIQVIVIQRRTDGAVKFLLLQVVIVFLLFVLFNGKNVTEQPFKNLSVAVDRDINFLVVRNLFKAPVEVLHVADKEAPGERKVTLFVFRVVNDMNHNGVFEISPFKL